MRETNLWRELPWHRTASWAKADANEKVLRDFRCDRCGKVYRRYLSVREFALYKTCECGGELHW